MPKYHFLVELVTEVEIESNVDFVSVLFARADPVMNRTTITEPLPTAIADFIHFVLDTYAENTTVMPGAAPQLHLNWQSKLQNRFNALVNALHAKTQGTKRWTHTRKTEASTSFSANKNLLTFPDSHTTPSSPEPKLSAS